MAICMTRGTGASPRADGRWLHALAAFAFLCASAPNMPLLAQGIDSEEAIDKIVGSDVKTEETGAKSNEERIVAAIENTRENAEKVRKTFNLNELDIVFVPDIGEEESAIEETIADRDVEIQALREAIEGSALFYHAVDSRSIMVRDIIAMEYGDDETVTIFVSGSPPQQ